MTPTELLRAFLEDLVSRGAGSYRWAKKRIDRVLVRGGKLADQKVWNDMGEGLRRRG